MSRTTDHIINTAADRAASDANEIAWLRHEVTRLEDVVARAALMLDEGDPLKALRELNEDLLDARLGDEARTVAVAAATWWKVRKLLAGLCP